MSLSLIRRMALDPKDMAADRLSACLDWFDAHGLAMGDGSGSASEQT